MDGLSAARWARWLRVPPSGRGTRLGSVPFLIYSVLRLAVLVICAVVLFQLGMRGWLMVGASLLLALGVSYAALRGPRVKAAEYLAARRARREGGHRFSDTQEEDFASEDAQIDAARATGTLTADSPSEDEAQPQQ